MELVSTIKAAKGEHWRETVLCLLLNLFGSLMPVWLTVILLLLFKQWQGLFPLLEHGELSIYSASLLSSSIYLMFKDSRKNKGYIVVTVFLLVIVAVLFAGVRSEELLTSASYGIRRIDQLFLFRTTLFLFAYSILSFFVTNFYENVKTSPPIRQIGKDEFDKFENYFDRLER